MASAPTNGAFLAISDIHFDPFDGLDSSQLKHLSTLDVIGWADYLDDHAATQKARSGDDANWALTKEVLRKAKVEAKAAKVDFVIYPGDFLRHDVWYQGAPDTAFYKKMVELILQELAECCPGKPVFMTFGNDDSYQADYALDAAFLADMGTVCRPYLGAPVDDHGFRDFTSHGCYSATLPDNIRLIALANVSWSHSHMNHMATKAGDAVVDYLNTELAAADTAGQRVWLLLHIPPGGSTHGDGTHVGANWKARFDGDFQEALDNHAGIVDIAFTGHTHMDDFRFGAYKNPTGGQGADHVVMYKIVPGVSPKFGQSPGFQIYTTTNGVVSDWTTYFYKPTHRGGPYQWGTPYTARKDYSYTDPTALFRLFRKMSESAPTSDAAVVKAMANYASDFKVHRYPLSSDVVKRFVDNTVHLASHPPQVMHDDDSTSSSTIEELATAALANEDA